MARARRKPKPARESKLELVTASVDNPDWRPDLDGERAFPRKVLATVNVRESAISVLAARKDNHGRPLINESQVVAADRFRRFWEAMGGSGAGAIDYSRTKVDGGVIADPIDVAQMRAARHLAEAEHTLGARNYELVRRVCGEGAAVADLYGQKRDRLTATDNLRGSLDDLARIWGIAGRAIDRPNRKYEPKKVHEQNLYTAKRGGKTLRNRNERNSA